MNRRCMHLRCCVDSLRLRCVRVGGHIPGPPLSSQQQLSMDGSGGPQGARWLCKWGPAGNARCQSLSGLLRMWTLTQGAGPCGTSGNTLVLC